MHRLLTGQESRQQLYTMLTRGRHANHLCLQVVGDGDPHTLIRPDTISPRTPTETLHQIIARDEGPVSASSLLRGLIDPAARLFSTLHDHPVWGDYLARRSQLVADLAAQVQDHACRGDAEPAWAAPGGHLARRQRHQIPKARDQPEEPNSRRSRRSGNNASTGTSRAPPTRQQM